MPYHRALTHHIITCSCCTTRARVPLSRRFLCDHCFKFGESRKNHFFQIKDLLQKLTKYVEDNGIADAEAVEISDLHCPPLPEGALRSLRHSQESVWR